MKREKKGGRKTLEDGGRKAIISSAVRAGLGNGKRQVEGDQLAERMNSKCGLAMTGSQLVALGGWQLAAGKDRAANGGKEGHDGLGRSCCCLSRSKVTSGFEVVHTMGLQGMEAPCAGTSRYKRVRAAIILARYQVFCAAGEAAAGTCAGLG